MLKWVECDSYTGIMLCRRVQYSRFAWTSRFMGAETRIIIWNKSVVFPNVIWQMSVNWDTDMEEHTPKFKESKTKEHPNVHAQPAGRTWSLFTVKIPEPRFETTFRHCDSVTYSRISTGLGGLIFPCSSQPEGEERRREKTDKRDTEREQSVTAGTWAQVPSSCCWQE